jgi:hypothetical protein
MPQESLNMATSLPPTIDNVRDSMCVMFNSSSTVPVEENVKKLSPCIVRKSRVSTLIKFLTAKNPLYAASSDFEGFTMENLDALAGEQTRDDEDLTPPAVVFSFHYSSSVSYERSPSLRSLPYIYLRAVITRPPGCQRRIRTCLERPYVSP